MERTYRVAPLLLLMFAGAAPVQLPPIEIEADAAFRESFIAVMERQPGGWQLQPTLGPAVRQFPSQKMHWRRRNNDDAHVVVTYWRYSSRDDASLALHYHRKVISVATHDVKGFADEAFQPAGERNVIFRRGSFVFEVSTRSPSATIPLSMEFLDAADRVLADADAR